MDLFDLVKEETSVKSVPLAERMRARTLAEFFGQEHIVAENSLLRRAIKSDRLGSCIFWGPPGSGKTTLANIIANGTDGNFVKLNAVTAGVADVKKAVEEDGFLGIFKGSFTAAAVGCSAALVFGYLAALLFKGKRK